MKLKKKKEKKIMNEVLEKIQKIGIVPVVVLNDAKDARATCKSSLQWRTSMCRDYFPYRCSRGVNVHV